jgi:hypothetical protein
MTLMPSQPFVELDHDAGRGHQTPTFEELYGDF